MKIWSPDSQSYLVWSNDASMAYVVNAETRHVQAIPSLLPADSTFTKPYFMEWDGTKWSPDSQHIAFVYQDSETHHRTCIVTLTSMDYACTTLPGLNWYTDWSPDSTIFAFSHYHDHRNQIYFMMPAHHDLRVYHHPDTGRRLPISFDWSPDSQQFAFVPDSTGNVHILSKGEILNLQSVP